MKLICAQNELNTHLSLVGRAVPSRPSHPVLANILFSADPETQRVSLTGFDLSLGVQTSFAAQVEEGGTLTLPAKLFADIVSRLPDGDLTLDDEAGELLVTLTSRSGRYQVRGMSADEYPELPVVDGELTQLSVEALLEGLKGSLFSTSSDETKQVLTGVHVTMEPDLLEFAATDGHRLAVVQALNVEDDASANGKNGKKPGESSPNGQLDVTVPGKALRELERMLQNQQANAVTVRFDQVQLAFEWEDRRITSRLLEGQYPNYRQLIPAQFSRQLTVERRLLTAALERIAVLADQRNSIVKFSLDSNQQQVILSVDAQDVGSGREAIPAQISGDDLDIAFNVKYLLEGLKAFTTSDVQMQFNSPTSPSVVNPLGGMKMTYLVMPVQIRN